MKFKYYCSYCKRNIFGEHIEPEIPMKELVIFECFKCGNRLKVVNVNIEYSVIKDK